MKPIEIVFDYYGEKCNVRFWRSTYAYGRNLYIGILSWDEEIGFWSNHADLTVNLPGMRLNSNEAFINANSNSAMEIFKLLKEKGYVIDTGITRTSGWCVYPLVEFSEEFLNEIEDINEEEEDGGYGDV